MNQSNFNSKEQKSTELKFITPDFNSMIRITFWNGLGFIFLMFINSYVVIYFFGGSGLDLGIIMALQPLARLFSMPLIAYLTDRSSKKLLVFIGSIGRTIAYVFYWISLVVHNLYMFGFGTFLQGLLVGFFWPPFFSLISEKSFKGNRTQALATGRGKMIGYGFLMGAFISIPIFSLVSTFMPENISLMYSPLLIFATINLIAGYRFYLKVDESLTYESYHASLEDDILILNNKKVLKGVNDDKTVPKIGINEPKGRISGESKKMFYVGFTSLILAILVTSITGTMYTPFISAFLIENLLPSFSENIIPIIVMIVYFPAQVISQLAASTLGKLFDRTIPSMSVIFIYVFKAGLIWLLIYTFTPIDFAIVLIFLYIFIESNTYFIQAIMSRVSIKHRGKMFGLNIWIDQLGRVIGPIIGGFLWDTSAYSAPFIVSIFIGLGLIPLMIFAILKLNPYMIEQIEKE